MTPEERALLEREEARIAELVARLEKERDAAIDAKRRAERELALAGKRIEQGRAAVVYVERITEVEAERDDAREQADAAYETLRAVLPGTPLTLREAARLAAKALCGSDEQVGEQQGDGENGGGQ